MNRILKSKFSCGYKCLAATTATVADEAHFFMDIITELNEVDLVSDPDMTFIAPKDKPESFFPATFQNMLSYSEALYKKDKDVWVINNSKQAFRVRQ